MAKLNRKTLKNYFKSGERPSQQAFSDLIDSSVNILDDDFSNVRDTALKVTGNNERRTAISIYTQPDDKEAAWNILISKDGELRCSAAGDKNNLILSPEGDVVLDSEKIYLQGKSILQGKAGNCPADGRWHYVSAEYASVNMYEITAVYSAGGNRYTTILKACASHCNGRKRIVNRMRPFSFFWQNKLKVKWVKIKNKKGGAVILRLAIRTRYFNKNGTIQYRIRQTWQNETIKIQRSDLF